MGRYTHADPLGFGSEPLIGFVFGEDDPSEVLGSYDLTLNPDPDRIASGDWNLFSYALNSPVNYFDPSGRAPIRFDGPRLNPVKGTGRICQVHVDVKGRPFMVRLDYHPLKGKGPLPRLHVNFEYQGVFNKHLDLEPGRKGLRACGLTCVRTVLMFRHMVFVSPCVFNPSLPGCREQEIN